MSDKPKELTGRRIESPFSAGGGLVGEWPKAGDYYFYPDVGWCGVAASGDDEELKEAIGELLAAVRAYDETHEPYTVNNPAEAIRLSEARQSLESLFGRIKEERDRLEAECLMELLHEPTGKMLPVRVRTVVQALESELGRIREELKEAQTTIETRRKFEQDAATDLSEAWEEIRRLRSSSLTPEEAQFIVQRVSSLGVSHPHFQMVTPTIYEKLRSIAGPPDKKEQ